MIRHPTRHYADRKDRRCAVQRHQVTDTAAAVRRGSLRQRREDQILALIAIALDHDLFAARRGRAKPEFVFAFEQKLGRAHPPQCQHRRDRRPLPKKIEM